MTHRLSAIVLSVLLFLPLFASAQRVAIAAHTKAELVSDVTAVAPGQAFWLALRLESQPKWHTYWSNPGEAGLPTTLEWSALPEGFTVGEDFLWPAPFFYSMSGIVSYVYEGAVYLLLPARAPQNLEPGQTLVFKARAEWLECDDKGCWPGGADVALTLQSVEGVSAATRNGDTPALAQGGAAGEVPAQGGAVVSKTLAKGGAVAQSGTAEPDLAPSHPSAFAPALAQTLAALPRALPQQWQAVATRNADGSYLLQLIPVNEDGGQANRAGQSPPVGGNNALGETATAVSGAASGGSAASAADQSSAASPALPLSGMPRSVEQAAAWSMPLAAQGGKAAQLAAGGLANAATNIAVEPIYFFPHSEDVASTTPQAQQARRLADGSVEVTLRPFAAGGVLEKIDGVFTSANGWLEGGTVLALAVDVTVGEGSAAGSSAGAGGVAAGTAASGVALSLRLLGLAFVGGLILNLMPCVFPVLGIKVLGFVEQAGSARRKVVLHGIAFTAGVLISFWVLSGALIALRLGGAELGWGFQLQSPAFVAALTVLLLVFGLSLSGVFEMGYGAMSVGGNLAAKGGTKGSFFSGVLATVVATPCAAPFLAPALGAALALAPADSMLVFTAIGLGLAAPYLLLSLFPALVAKLPRPGAWMETFKQFMAFLLYATVAYLVYVLAGLVADERFLNILLGLVAVGVACWAYGRWLRPGSRTKIRGWAGTVLFAALGAWLIFSPVQKLEWEDWSPERVAQLQAQGRPVYVDFTARWCATCQVNKRVVFGSEAVLEQFRKERVALLKADWTDRNDAITAELAQYGRSAVPFNLFYGAKGKAHANDPLVLPELLTPGIVLDALQEVTK